MASIKPIEIDIVSIRVHRQNENNMLANTSITRRDLTKNINKEEYKRVLQELQRVNISEDELLDECRNNIMTTTLLAGRISINASRQGSNDEQQQLEVCSNTFSKCGIVLHNLSSTSFRPTKNGKIIDNNEMKKRKIKKEDCLKSFDAKLSGKVEGWVFAKIVIGSGGHQDNVFEEAQTFCDWVVKYGNETELYIILLDTTLIEKLNDLITRYEGYPNLLIGTHIKVQQFIIDKYYEGDDSNGSNSPQMS
jgi:hypothetical protein